MEFRPLYRSCLLCSVAHGSVRLGEGRPFALHRSESQHPESRRTCERRRAWQTLLWLAGWLVRYWARTPHMDMTPTPAALRPALERERGACACNTIPCACRRERRSPRSRGVSSPTPRLVYVWIRTGQRGGCRFHHTPRPGIGRGWRTPGDMRAYNGAGQIMAVIRVAFARIRGVRRSTMFYGRLWRIGILFTVRTGLPARDLLIRILTRLLPEAAHDPPT